jgi:malate dehydrogenase
MAVPSPGAYGVEEGLISSFPVVTKDQKWEIVDGLDINDFSRERIDATVNELKQERDTVKQQGLI